MNRNYQKELDTLIEKNKLTAVRPKLMLHACCACCASFVLEYLVEHFEIYILYYNPNITDSSEYEYRQREVRRLINEMLPDSDVKIVECDYTPDDYLRYVSGLEAEREGGARCTKCFDMRLRATAKKALEYGCDYFATTLTISPLKNANVINSIGEELSKEFGVKYLASDFKKKNGYKRSIELSKEYNLYRQNYCGCEFSKK